MRGTKPFSTVTRDTSSVNITNSHTELVSSLGADCSGIVIGASANMQVIMGIGASGSETDFLAYAASSVLANHISVVIPKGARLTIRSVTGTISSGVFAITFMN